MHATAVSPSIISTHLRPTRARHVGMHRVATFRRVEARRVTSRAPESLAAHPEKPQNDFGSKLNTFSRLVRECPDYRKILTAACVRNAGTGALSGCFIGLLAGAGGLSAASSFMAYAVVEAAQLFLSGVMGIYGAHRRDEAQPTGGAKADAQQRAAYAKELRVLCLSDIVTVAVICGTTIARKMHPTAGFALLAPLLAVRVASSAQNGLEGNLFTCLRQLNKSPKEAALAESAGQTLLLCEAFLGAVVYHSASMAVQFSLLALAPGMFTPCLLGAAVVGGLACILPKLAV